MQQALALALRGWGRVYPNPMVGAVVLADDGTVVGSGYHGEYGGPHAEAVALAAAGDRARGSTLVVTLEPCVHVGKQPACVDRIVESGIRRVVIATPDPNRIAAGGAARLEAAGVAVEVGTQRIAAERLNAAYLKQVRSARPFVAVKLATSLDHRIADAAGHSRWISGEEARDWVHWYRAGFQAIGVGGRTALVDDPMLTVRGALEPRAAPTRVIFLGGRRLPMDSMLVRTAGEVPTVIVSNQLTSIELSACSERGIAVIEAAGLEAALEELAREGVGSIVIEGGGRLVGALLAAGLVDRFALILSPVWLGDSGLPATRGWDVPSLLQAERWTAVERKELGEDTLLVFDLR